MRHPPQDSGTADSAAGCRTRPGRLDRAEQPLRARGTQRAVGTAAGICQQLRTGPVRCRRVGAGAGYQPALDSTQRKAGRGAARKPGDGERPPGAPGSADHDRRTARRHRLRTDREPPLPALLQPARTDVSELQVAAGPPQRPGALPRRAAAPEQIRRPGSEPPAHHAAGRGANN